MANTVLYGRMTRDVDLKYGGQNNTAVGRFGIAVNRKYQKGDIKTDFFNIVCFGKQAETISQFFHKGSRIVVYCNPQQNQYTKQDGTKVNSIEFVLEGFDFVDTKAESGIVQQQNTGAQHQQSQAPAQQDAGFMNIPNEVDEGGLPFD